MIRIALIFFCASLGVRGIYYTLTEGFCLKRIQEQVEFPEDLTIDPPSNSILTMLRKICNQPYTYLTKGSQAYAFISKDGKYILKLFKYHHMKPAEWLLSYPLPKNLSEYRNQLVARRRHRINLSLRSYKISATQLTKECALYYAQILDSALYTLPITITDAIGRTYTIDLAKHGYVIQKKADLLIPSFETWIYNKDLVSAKLAIDSLVKLIAHRSKKGIQDSDPDLHKNAGLIGTQAVFIDIGGFHINPKITQHNEMKRDMQKVFSKFQTWLNIHSPELAQYLENKLQAPWESL